MCPWIPWKLVVDLMESAKHTLGTAGEGQTLHNIFYVLFNKIILSHIGCAQQIPFVLHDYVQFS
jgi:hypothetical protein